MSKVTDNFRALVKLAQDGAGSTPVQEVLAGYPGALLAAPWVGSLPGGIGTIAGLVADRNDSPRKLGPAFIPGVTQYRLANRLKSQALREEEEAKKAKSKAKPIRHLVSEYLGSGTSMLAGSGLGALAGAGIGALANSADRKDGAVGGAFAGAAGGAITALTATVIASIAAAIKRRRTAKEQMLNDEKSVLPKYIVPGMAAYDYYKRLGRSQGDREDDVAKKNKGKKKDK